MKPATPLPWHTRGPARGLRLFIEAPKANGMPYALDVCGDDYTGYGDDEAREANMRYIVHARECLSNSGRHSPQRQERPLGSSWW